MAITASRVGSGPLSRSASRTAASSAAATVPAATVVSASPRSCALAIDFE
jgi:hypothetical protein